MKIMIESTHEAMSEKAAQYIIEIMQQHPTGLYCFAGGDTPVETIGHLVDAHVAGQIDLTKAFFVELDEWVGLDETDFGSCAYYLQENLVKKAKIPESQLHFFSTKNTTLETECEKAKAFIEAHGGITLSLLGVGVNGHVGFNEPGSTADTDVRVIALDEKTQQVGKKYFKDQSAIAELGITLGLKQLLASSYITVLASGISKQDAISTLVHGAVSPSCPVTYVKEHVDSVVFLDELAAEKI